nr:hypothetical protein Iba_chr12cCG13420 [Ipomoea batatas]GMD68482.1 hypothetical protein Iba_chr12dCG9590 [Ipomoea batatas]
MRVTRPSSVLWITPVALVLTALPYSQMGCAFFPTPFLPTHLTPSIASISVRPWAPARVTSPAPPPSLKLTPAMDLVFTHHLQVPPEEEQEQEEQVPHHRRFILHNHRRLRRLQPHFQTMGLDLKFQTSQIPVDQKRF